MPRCQHCQRSLDVEASHASGPVLGESYVFLPTASASHSMLLMQKLASPAGFPGPNGSEDVGSAFNELGEDLYASARYNLTLRQQQQQHQQQQQQRRRVSSASNRRSESSRGALGAGVRSELADSAFDVPTLADLNRQVQLLTAHHAHCAGAPVTTPVCKECVDTMLNLIDGQAELARYEKRCFAGYLHSSGSSARSEEVGPILDKVRFYDQEVKELEENLAMMEKEREDIAQQQEELQLEEEALLQEELALWEELNELQLEQEAFREIRDMAIAKIEAAETKVANAKYVNILNDMFTIGASGVYGMINQFRLGQTTAQPVEWNEINAALGECALLLQTLANVLGFEFSDFKLVPLGSFSKVIRTTDLRMEYRLHGSDHDNFAESHLNLGLGAWVICLGQLVSYVEARDRSMRLPYKVSKHSVGGYSVLYLRNKHSEWTKALKYALTNLKWLLTWVSARGFAAASTPRRLAQSRLDE